MLKTLTIPESVHLHFTCPAATPYEFTQLVLIILKKKWWEYLSVYTLRNKRPLYQEFNTNKTHVYRWKNMSNSSSYVFQPLSV